MGFPNFVVALFFITSVCQSDGVIPMKNALRFHDGFAVIWSLSSVSLKGEDFMTGTMSPFAKINITVETRYASDAEFMIFQVHSYLKPLVLSSSYVLENGSHVNGTNTGLHTDVTYYKRTTFYIMNPNPEPVSTMLLPVLYRGGDPVPGGCNLSFPVNIAPVMKLTYENHNEIIQVDAEAASSQNQSDCQPSGLLYDVYVYSIGDTTADGYFNGILSVITADKADSHGYQTGKPLHQPELRRRFASYCGFGSVYVVTVRDAQTGRSSAYVPIAAYNCIEGNDDGDCDSQTYSLLILFIIAVVYIGAEIRHVFGRDEKAFMRTVFIMGSVITFAPALPLSIRWGVIGFISLVLLIACILGKANYSGPLDVISDHLYPLVPAHIFFGLLIFSGLGLFSAFQDLLIVTYTFGIFFLLFYILMRICPEHTADQYCGLYVLFTLVSLANKGSLYFSYVDASRILRHEFSGVIFSPPNLWPDQLLVILWACLLLFACQPIRRAFRQKFGPRDYQDMDTPPPPYSTQYMTV